MKSTTRERVALMGIVSLFAAEIALASLHLPQMDSMLLAALGLAAFRGGRAISFNGIFVWLREWFSVVPESDSSGAGDSNNAKGEGATKAIGDLLCCPICSGTHVASLLLLAYSILPTLGLAAIYALAAAGIAEVLHWISEHYEWSGRNNREQAGSQWLSKNKTAVHMSNNGHKESQRETDNISF